MLLIFSTAGIILDIYSMCGIAGIINSEPRQPAGNEEYLSLLRDRLHKMTTSLQHRGPDGEGLWLDSTGRAGLGHRRLSIIDLSDAGIQPMHYLNRYTIVHNGEIYNHIELRSALEKEGYSFHSQTDTEVIAAAYAFWKDECVDHFDGMFSFAIWDEEAGELFASRDRFGEKPFYYCFDGEHFLFASEMKAFWAAGIERRPNLKMLFNFITIGYTDNPAQPDETFFENISKLPAATTLTYYAGLNELSLYKYWDIDPEEQDKKISDNEALEQFDHLFTLSVKRRLRSDVEIGTSLSGGLDSSSVIAVLNELHAIKSPENDLSYKLKTFTAVFPGFEKDESAFAKQVATQFGLQQFTVEISAKGLANDWERLVYHQEEPFGSASLYAQYSVFELAAKQQVKVLLDGQGADETLAGYHKYYKWYWQELFHKRKLMRSQELIAAKRNNVEEGFGFRNILASLFPDLATMILERQYLLKALRQEDLNREFVRLQSKEAYYTTPAHFTLNGVLYFNTCMHGLEELLRYADRNSMAHGREVRLPFLSHELVEFIFSLPSHFKIRNGWTKWLLREAMKNKLSATIAWRKDKIGFEPPQKKWMQDTQVQELIHSAKVKLVNEKILDKQVLNKKINPQSAHEADNYDWRYLSAASLLK